MGKILVEVCMISGRGLRRTSSLWKLKWFAVGWIDPANKYCTKIDTSGSSNPVWRTKFSSLMDTSEFSSSSQDLALHVEVYSRDPIFLREKLLGTATVALKEFFDKYEKDSNSSEVVSKQVEEVGSFQLRAKSSGKPQGFVDVSVKVSAESEDPVSVSLPGVHEGFKLDSGNENVTLSNSNQYGAPQTYYTPYAVPYPASYPHLSSVAGPSYQPPPPPPANVGHMPTLLPSTYHNSNAPSYISMPSSGAAVPHGAGQASHGPGFAVGLGAGALAAGAVISGSNFMSAFDFPGSFSDSSIRISTNHPF